MMSLIRASEGRDLTAGFLRPWVKKEQRLARLACLLPSTTLKDRMLPVTVAARAYEMRGIVAAIGFLQAVDKITGLRFPKLVAVKLCLRLVRLSDRIAEHGYLRLQKLVLETRVLHCSNNLRNGGFNLGLASSLRRLGQALETGGSFSSFPDRARNARGGLGDALKKLEIEIHRFHSNAQALRHLGAMVRAGLPKEEQR